MFASVAVPVPLLGTLTYRVPSSLEIVRGARVVVPLGRRLVTGIVTAVTADAESDAERADIRDVAALLDVEAFLPNHIVDLALWMSDYYLCAPGEAIAAAMPPLAWVESERRWSITDEGLAARQAPLRIAGGDLLTLLEDAHLHATSELARRWARDKGADAINRARVQRWLTRMETEGFVRSVDEMQGEADASLTERVVIVTATAGQPNAHLSKRQAEALETIVAASNPDAPASASSLRAAGVTPAVLNALLKKGVVAVSERPVERRGEQQLTPYDAGLAAEQGVLSLTGEQEEAVASLHGALSAGGFQVSLLHGVTGSGKTEVYRRVAQAARALGRRVLLLVPEIALTPAVAARFRALFGDAVAIQHSALSDGERYDQWRRIRRGGADVVVGTRSAVFAPLDNVGLVIVDEEHDTAYKQEESPRYHGRDLAIVRARAAGALVILGSATPSLESYQHAMTERYALVRLTRRVLGRPMADVQVVNMRTEFAEAGPDVVLSGVLHQAIADRLAEREQAMVLLNRRGFAANVFCRQCGDTLDCPNCSVSLTVHRAANRARCHYCDYSRRLPDACVKCGAEYLDYQGIGTERVESELQQAFPEARVARADRDTVRRRGQITQLLGRFGRRELDILVGTQMIAKGHDFPAVTLVGVISADVGLGLADFRAAERTFQLLTQVAGRAGRGERPGQAIIQTLVPEHYSVQLARAQDYTGFFEHESRYRGAMRYPPSVSLINVVLRNRVERDAWRDAALIADALRARSGFKVMGPAPAPLSRLRGHYRVQVFLKGTHRGVMRRAVQDALRGYPQLTRAVTVDVDPMTMM